MVKANAAADEGVRYHLLLPLAIRLPTVGRLVMSLQNSWTAGPVGTGTIPTLTKTESLEVSQPVFGFVWLA